MDLLNRMYFASKLRLQEFTENFLRDEDGAVDIVAVVVLIGIAVALAVIFKDRIQILVRDLLDTIDTGAKNAVN